METALKRNIPVIPLLVSLAFRNAQEVGPDPNFDHDLNRVMNDVEKHLTRG